MPYEFHLDPKKKWEQQYLATKYHILPFLKEVISLSDLSNVLEIGCGEGGVLKAFCDEGYTCYGVDIASHRIESARHILSDDVRAKRVTFYAADVHDTETFAHLMGQVDLLILKDAIEHIYQQEKILQVLHQFVRPGGHVFIAFPPWWNPFGGHQQVAQSFLRFVPWFHVFPRALYQKILQTCGEPEAKVNGLLEVYDTRLPVRKFESLLHCTDWPVLKRQFFLFNPIYEYKFGLKGRRQFELVSGIPLLRDFLSTAVYYVLQG